VKALPKLLYFYNLISWESKPNLECLQANDRYKSGERMTKKLFYLSLILLLAFAGCKKTGKLFGVSDPRRLGYANGF